MTMLRWTLIVAAVLIGIPALLALIGVFLPQNHVAARTITLAAPPDRVFATISDIDKLTTWRSDLKGVERLADDGKGVRYVEKSSTGDILFRVEELEPNNRIVTRIADPKLPFGGAWTFDLKPSGAGTELTITEAGEVYNVFFRTMQKLFFSPTKTIETYQADLGKYLAK
jgi:uncharacterized protein YndB with AHSA1/START domain